MTSDQASERVAKLRAIRVERGASPHEAATAAALASRLSARYGLGQRPEHVARYAASARSDRRSSRALRFVAFG